MDQIRAKQVWEKMLAAEHILIINDVGIDGDTLGSGIAVGHELEKRGKRVTYVSPVDLGEFYTFLPHFSEIHTDRTVLGDESIDLALSFDCSNGDHVVELREAVPSHPFLISFDHHRGNVLYGDMNLVVDSMSSTAELVWQFFKLVGILPDRDSATCLLTGICYDTGTFSNPSTNKNSLEAASELSLLGARVSQIVQQLYITKSVDGLKLWGLALERLREHPEHGFVTTYFTRQDLDETESTDEDLIGFSNFLGAVLQNDTVMVFRETQQGHVKASMRTTSGDVNKIASWFPGGGGHRGASGFTVRNTRIVDVLGPLVS